MSKGITKEQTHRILEDLQRNALSLVSFQNKANLLRKIGKQQNLPILSIVGEGIDNDVGILKESLDGLKNDMKGMMNGNDKGG